MIPPLNHGPECRICAVVDIYMANRKRPRHSIEPSTARPSAPSLKAGARLDGSIDLRERVTGTAGE